MGYSTKPIDTYVKNVESGEVVIETDILPVARDVVETILRRYHGSEKHWTQGERVNTFWGMLGELVFGGYLYQYNVPNVYNNPIYQEKVGMKQYDFLIPHFGTVEVKGIGPEPNKRNLLVKVSEWKKSEYVVAVKFDSEEHGRLAGWLTGREAENLPSRDFGYGQCYWKPLDQLRPMGKFHELLIQLLRETGK